jgi:serine/threonine-protein kinase
MTNPTPAPLRELFEAALALAPSERAAFLDERCADAHVRAQVDAMLRADACAGEPVSSERLARMAQALGEDEGVPALPAGSRVGAFEIVRAIGEGGSSTVFEARREFEGATQRVALKLLRQSLLGAEARRRFGREQRALIRLQHPHIARLIEGGVSDGGAAYIALELVDGQPITDYARERALDARARLRLFATTCRAVDAAHRALIVHRDLKPSNVLVTADGEIKLLDFGIAKLLADEADTEATLLPAFTPAYAAPEQAAGGAITTATDVYALGVVLGELLTGTRHSPAVTPTPPARRPDSLQAQTTGRRLRGDLQAVVSKATEADPERRYASAGALADEIERLLDGRPVQAQPQTRWYRARKFVTRHKGGVAGTFAFLIAILAALGVALWQAGVARREAARVHAENRFIAGLFDPLHTGVQEGEVPSVRQLLDAGVAQLGAQFGGDDATLADLALLFSRVHIEIGAPEVASELAERAYAHARAAWGERDPRTWAALARRGEAAYYLDRYAQATTDLEQATAGMRAAGTRGEDYAFALEDLGLVYAKTGRSAEAVTAQLGAYEVLKDSGDRIELATVMNNLGGAYLAAGDAERALQWRQRAYDWHVAHGLGGNRAALVVLGNLARVKFGLGRWREALADLDRLLPLRDKVAGGNRKRWTVSTQACSTAYWLWQLDKAQAYCERALADAEGESAPARPRAIVLGYRGALRVRQGRYGEARADLVESNRLLATIEGDNADAIYGNALDLAEMVRVEGTPEEHVAALAPLLPTAQNQHKRAAVSALLLARFALACEELDATADACRDDTAARAESLLATLRAGHPYRLPTVTALALRSVRSGDAPAAVERLRSALADGRSELGADHPWVGEAQAALAVAAVAAGDRALAGEAERESERIAALLPPDHPLRRHLPHAR